MGTGSTSPINYSEENIRTLEWNQHIRQRPGMYIGQLGNGSDPRDGIYTLLKEIIDNSIDEFTMGFGTNIIVDVDETSASVRDFGRGRAFLVHRPAMPGICLRPVQGGEARSMLRLPVH